MSANFSALRTSCSLSLTPSIFCFFFILRLLLLLLLLLLLAVSAPSPAHAFSINSADNMTDGTVLHALQTRSAAATRPTFDDNWNDYDILLHLISHANFAATLSAPHGNGITLFTTSDAGMRQTTRDLLRVHHLPSRPLQTERAVYEALNDLLATLYTKPLAALTILLRYHVVPARLTLPDVVGVGSFNTLAAQPIARLGITLESTDHRFHMPQLTIMPPSLHAGNGNVHNIDRLLIPDMSPFEKPTPAATKTPSPPSAPGAAASHPPTPQTMTTATATPAATETMETDTVEVSHRKTITPSPSPSLLPMQPALSQPSPQPSITALPSSTVAVMPMVSASPFMSSTPSKTPPPSRMPAAGVGANGLDDGTDGDAECFPGSATLQTRRGPVALSRVSVGTEVHTGQGWEPVIAFSHAVHAGTFRYVELTVARQNVSTGTTRLRPADGVMTMTMTMTVLMTVPMTVPMTMTVRATHGHLLPCGTNGRLVPAGQFVVGDRLRTADGQLASVVAVREVRDRGLFAPHTASGNVLVDGVVASCYTTAVRPATAHAWLAVVRALVRGGVENPVSGVLDGGAQPLMRWWASLSEAV